MFTNTKLANSIRIAMAVGAASTAMVASTTIAQEAAAKESSVEKIAVTGSRIRKADFISNAPVATIGQEQFALSATVNTESLLNTLPQVVPGLDRSSNNPGDGTATVDLRGLGTNRTLVLINGQRVTPTTAGGSVDINSIPTALIQDVEVLTGGASAVYGSDAVAGVVNFILKDDFEGVQTNVGYEVTDENDASIWSADFTLGGNFSDGRGNVVFNMSFTDRDALFQGDRDFAEFALFDDGSGGLEPGGSSGIPQARINGNFEGFTGPGILFNQDGSLSQRRNPEDSYNYAPVNYIQVPQTRHQFNALGHFEVSDNVELYGRAAFTDSEVPQQLAPTPIFGFEDFTLDGNPFITPEAQQVLSDSIGKGVDTDNDGIDDLARGNFGRRLQEVGFRRAQSSFTSSQFLVGARGVISDSSWTYDAYYSTGQVENVDVQLGNVNSDRYAQALILATDPATGEVLLDANGNPSCADTNANGGTVDCSPLNIFGEGNISQVSANFIKTAVASTAIFEQDIFEASLTGDTEGLVELPGGPIGIAVGFQHIENRFEFLPSQDLAANTIAGFNGAPPVAGAYKVDEYYAEMYLPILDDAPFADTLDVELAYRTSDYDTIGGTSAYKIGGSWAPIEEVRFRAGFNRAVRAPNIGELFSPRGENFPGATDPCSLEGAPDGTQADQPVDLVKAICAATGVPAGNIFSSVIDSAAQQIRTLSGGNPNLKEEEADTFTLGVVVVASEELTFSLDYFDIEIIDAIASFGGGTSNVLNTCYSNRPGSGVGGPFCNIITRLSDGSIDGVEISQQNVAVQTLKGYDLIASYKSDIDVGALSVDYLGTLTTENDFTPFEGASVIECAGFFGTICGEPIPEYKHRMTFKLATDDFTAQLLWRFVGQVSDDDDTNVYTVERVGGKNYFDVSGTYFINDNYRLTAGIDNFFDKKPPIIGGNDEQANTYPATYDVYGRTYFVKFTASF